MRKMYEGHCRCGSEIYDEVIDEMTCQKCGIVLIYSKRLKSKMEKGYCSNCGALLFGLETKLITTARTEPSPNL